MEPCGTPHLFYLLCCLITYRHKAVLALLAGIRPLHITTEDSIYYDRYQFWEFAIILSVASLFCLLRDLTALSSVYVS